MHHYIIMLSTKLQQAARVSGTQKSLNLQDLQDPYRSLLRFVKDATVPYLSLSAN